MEIKSLLRLLIKARYQKENKREKKKENKRDTAAGEIAIDRGPRKW